MIEDSQEKRCITSYLLSNLIENCDEDLLYKIIYLIEEWGKKIIIYIFI